MRLMVNLRRNMRVAVLTGAALLSGAAQAQTAVITADKMIDVLTGKTVDFPAVFVGPDGRITSIADARTVKWGSDVTHINMSGKTLLPGLIDMHVHLDGPADIGGYRGLEFTDSFWGMTAVGSAQAMLKAGFTTVRNVGSSNRNDIGLKQAIQNGYATGPRIVPAGYALGATGGHCDSTFLPPSLEKSDKEEGIADSEDELRYQVRRQRKYGAEVIKVCATGGVFSRNTEPGQQQLSERELRVIADEAHQWGLRVAAHAHGAEGIKAAIKGGIDTIEHASLVDDEGIKLAVARPRPVWFSMDIYNTDYTQAEGAKNGVLEDNLRKDREVAQIQRDNFRKAFDDFQPEKIARYTDKKVHALMNDAGIVRNRAKIEGAVASAKGYLEIMDKGPGFSKFLWDFVDGKPKVNQFKTTASVPASTPVSIKVSKELGARGFKFVGPTIVYAFMQATGMVNDHLVTCFCHETCSGKLRTPRLKKK